MDAQASLTLQWNARYTRLRSLALRSLTLAAACAVIVVVFHFLGRPAGPDVVPEPSLTAMKWVWIIITAAVLVFVIVVEVMKDRLPKFELVLRKGDTSEIIYTTRDPDDAREALTRLGREHGLDKAQVVNEALTRPKH